MFFIRSLLFNICFYLWAGGGLIFGAPLLLGPRRYAVRYAGFLAQGTLFLLKTLVGLTFEVQGRENLPQGACILACKHQSMWETFVFHWLLPDVAYVLKKELSYIPLYGQFIRKYKMVLVDRKKKQQALTQLIKQAQEILSQKRQLVIFPEGTRSDPFATEPRYQRGIASLYEACKVPVVPVALNSGLFWGRRSFMKRPGKIVVHYLPPLPLGLPRDHFMDTLKENIETRSAQLVKKIRK